MNKAEMTKRLFGMEEISNDDLLQRYIMLHLFYKRKNERVALTYFMMGAVSGLLIWVVVLLFSEILS